MPNDFKLEAGHKFTFQGVPKPAAGFGGNGHCEVLEFEPEKMLRLAWRAAPEDPSTLDSTVTFTLEPEGHGTRLFLAHEGFDPGDQYQAAARRIMGEGWQGVAAGIARVVEGLLPIAPSIATTMHAGSRVLISVTAEDTDGRLDGEPDRQAVRLRALRDPAARGQTRHGRAGVPRRADDDREAQAAPGFRLTWPRCT